MGKRGPAPVSRTAIKTLARQLFKDFQKLAKGYSHRQFDHRLYHRLKRQLKLPVSEAAEAEFVRKGDQIRHSARLTEVERDNRFKMLAYEWQWAPNELNYARALEKAMKRVRVKGLNNLIDALLEARTPSDVRNICRAASVPLVYELVDPKTLLEGSCGDSDNEPRDILQVPNSLVGDTLSEYLSRHSEQFVAAKNDPRFPSSKRQSTRSKQLWFLSCALAGANFELEAGTAIKLVGPKR